MTGMLIDCFKLKILVSLRVFGTKSHYICPFTYRLGLCIKKFTKNAVMSALIWSSLGVSLSVSHTHISLPWGFHPRLLFRDSSRVVSPAPVEMEDSIRLWLMKTSWLLKLVTNSQITHQPVPGSKIVGKANPKISAKNRVRTGKRGFHDVSGSLSRDVFERRTSTGSELFSLLVCLDANKFVLLSFFSPLKTIYSRVSTKPLPNDAKSSLPVDVRRSKTLLLKLPILSYPGSRT